MLNLNENIENLRTPEEIADDLLQENRRMIKYKNTPLPITSYKSPTIPLNDLEYDLLLATIPIDVKVDVAPPTVRGQHNNSYLLRPERIPDDYALYYRPGMIVVFGAFPFDSIGRLINRMNPEDKEVFLKNRRLIHRLIANPRQKMLTEGFFDLPGYFYDLMPEKLKLDVDNGGCSFRVEYPAPLLDEMEADEVEYLKAQSTNKFWLYQKQMQALQNLQKMIEKARRPLN